MNGSLVQSFTYDAHDKMTGGLGESEGYDANGNLRTQTVNGQTTTFSWDDEDRLTGQQFGDGHTDSYGYTGLGMRLTKSDPTGGYSYLADGVSPASDVLTDGHTTFTPEGSHGACLMRQWKIFAAFAQPRMTRRGTARRVGEPRPYAAMMTNP